MRWKLFLVAGAAIAIVSLVTVVVTLRSIDFNEYRAVVAERVREATGRTLEIEGNLDVRFSLRPAVTVERVTLSNAEWGSRPRMLSLERLAVEVAPWPLLRGELQVRRLVLEGADLLLETGADGQGNWVFAAASGEPPAAARDETPLPESGEILLENLRVTWRDGASGRESALVLPRLVMRADGGPVRFEASGDLDGRRLEAAAVGGPLPVLWAAGRYPLEVDLRYGASDAAAKATFDLGARPPRIRGEIHSRTLDLADFESGGPARRRTRLFGDEPLPLDGMRGVDAAVELVVEDLRTRFLPLRNVHATLAIGEGALSVTPLRGELAGGEVDGEWTLTSVGGEAEVSARVDARGVDLGELLTVLGEPGAATGHGSLRAELRGRGASIREIAAGSDGGLTLLVEGGRVRGRNLELLAADLLKVFAVWFRRDEDTRVGCLVGRFDVQDGIARSRALLLDTDRIVVVGKGDVNLRTEVISIDLLPRPKRQTFVSLAVPIQVRGTLTHPRASPDHLGVVKKLGGSILGAVLFPPALLTTLGDLGAGENGACAAAIAGGSLPVAEKRGVGGFLRDLGGKIERGFGFDD